MLSQDKIKKFIALYLPQRALDLIMKYRFPYNFYQNINYDPATQNQKRILLSYITSPLENDTSKLTTHTNFTECLEIIKTFIDFGYCIDLVFCLDDKHTIFIEKKRYDVIFGFGEPFHCAALKNPDAIKIVYLTELHPDFSLKNEMERTEYYYQRHNKRVNIKRSGKFIRNQDIAIGDYGILMGNKFTSRIFSFPQGNLYTLEPTALINPEYICKKREYEKSRKNFVWFGSYGAIHKGLDILIDVFNDLPELNLYICGLNREEKRILRTIKENIHDMGFINVKSQSYIDLMDSCSYVILPSCSEGMATSVLTCMNHGLIPIVTKECGIDLQEWGVCLDDYHVDYIKEKVRSCALCDVDTLEKYHNEVFEYSRKKFNLQRYSQDFRQIIMDILSKKRT